MFAVLLGVLSVLAGNAIAFDISGTVTNGTGKSGRIYLSVQHAGGGGTGLGVSIPSAGPYTIRGVPSGTYNVQAFADTQVPEGGIRHASDPVGLSPQINITGASVTTGADITLKDPPAPSLAPPGSARAVPGDGLAFVTWNPARTPDGAEGARYYTVYWSETPHPGLFNQKGNSGDLASSRNGGYLVTGLSNGKSYYFAVTARLAKGAAESAPADVNDGMPLLLGGASGGYQISGTLNSTGIGKNGATLWVAAALRHGGPVAFASIANPSDTQSYTIPGVPPGTYQLYAVLDMNNNGVIDTGDYMTADSKATSVTVSSSDLTNADFSLTPADTEVSVATGHSSDGTNQWYSLNFQAGSVHRLPVNVAVSGPQLPGAIDLAPDHDGGGRFSGWTGVPNRPQTTPTPDSYSFMVAYADSSTSPSLFAPVTAVLDASATPTAPVGTVPTVKPVFAWNAPSNPPASPYSYQVQLDGNNLHWSSPPLPSSQLSLPYDAEQMAPALTPGSKYTWSVRLADARENSVSGQNASFTIGSVPGSAQGTYAYDANGGALSLTWDTSSFVCEGPKLGTESEQVTVLSQTALTWSDPYDSANTMTWTRGAGSAGEILGTWSSTDPATGNSYTLTFNADGTMSASGKINQCGGSSSGSMPAIYGFNPMNGAAGTMVTINGSGFGSIGGSVNFNGQPASSISRWSDTEIVATVSAATFGSGPITVATPNWTVSSYGAFTVNPATNGVLIFGFAPQSGGVGTPVVINGANFDPNPANSTVTFNGVPAVVTGASSTSLTTTVPEGATSGPISVFAKGSTIWTQAPFMVAGGPISFSGFARNSAMLGIPGVKVEVLGSPSLSAVSGDDGRFTITNIPSGQPLTVKGSVAGSTDAYVGPFYGMNDIFGQDVLLYSGAETSNWGFTSGNGKGVIGGKVVDGSNPQAGGLSGVILTANSRLHPGQSYPVSYPDPSGTGGSATQGDGGYLILNVDAGDDVTLNASKPQYSFPPITVHVYQDGVSETGIVGKSTVASGGYLSVFPMSVYFNDPTGTGNYPTQPITFTNTGSSTLNVQSATLTGDTASFSIQPAGNNPCPQLPHAFAPNESCTMVASFTPSGTGPKNASLQVNSDSFNGSSLYISLSANSGAPAGSIAGKVTDLAGMPLPNVNVRAVDVASPNTFFSNTNFDGTYTISPVPGGTYKVQFEYHTPQSTTSVWYDKAVTIEGATPVQVSAPNRTGGIDAAIDTAVPGQFKVSGRLLDAAAQGVCGGDIGIYGPNGSASARTGSDGAYSLWLPAGDYTASVNYYPGSSNCGSAAGYPRYMASGNPLSVSAEMKQDFVLPPVYTVSGKVVDGKSLPIAGVSINFNSAPAPTGSTGTQPGSTGTQPGSTGTSGSNFYAFATSDVDGNYSVNLYGGTYNVNLSKDSTYAAVPGLVVQSNINRDFALVALTLGGFSPASGKAGTTVTITGSGFGTSANGNFVNFNGMPAPILSWSDSAVVTTVPVNAMSGMISLGVQGRFLSTSEPFTVLVDPPTVVQTVPWNGATAMPANGGVAVFFDKQMDRSSINTQTFSVQDATGAPVSGTVQARDNGYLFAPDSALSFGTTYTVTLGSGIRSSDGGALAPYSWSFSVAQALGNSFSLKGGVYNLESNHDNGTTNYLYQVVQTPGDGTVSDSWYSWLNGAWSKTAPLRKDQGYSLTASGWRQVSDSPENGTVALNADGSFTWTNSADGSSQRMEAIEYNLAGLPLQSFVNPADLPAPPTGSYPAGSMAYVFKNTALTDNYRCWVGSNDPSVPDQNVVRYYTNNQPQTVTTLAELQTLFATGQNNWLPLNGYAMQLGNNGSLQLATMSWQGPPTPLSLSGSWEMVTVNNEQLLMVHLPQEVKNGERGELFYAEVNGVVKQGGYTAKNTVEVDINPNFNQTAFSWLAGVSAPAPVKGSQTISMTSTLPSTMNLRGQLTLSATGGASGNPVVFTSLTPAVCSATGNNGALVSAIATGTCTIAAGQEGNANFEPAPQVKSSISVVATYPGAPQIVSAKGGNAQAVVSFAAPSFDGGSPITGYTVTSNPGGLSASGSTSPITVNGLANGTLYTFTVTAMNAAGTGAPSAPSASVIPVTVPDAPTSVSAAAGNASASVSFLKPAFDGGSAITGYTVTSTPGGLSATGTASPITVRGLVNGTAYTFTVTALNATGSGASSAPSAGVIPTTVPDAPTAVKAEGTDGSATVSFVTPAFDGGSAITGYTVTSAPGGISATGTASPITVKGLANGTVYTFTVTATNATGTGIPSAPSAGALVATVPGTPAAVSATVGDAHATVSFIAPLNNGGSAITGYTVTSTPGGIVVSGQTSPIVVTGLTTGTPYTFSVTANNVKGSGAPSAPSNTVTPDLIPGAPLEVSASAGNATATVTFTAPVSNGGSAITGYRVTSTPGGISAGGTASPITMSGLANGTAYTFTVVATNSKGSGTPSAPSNRVTPDVVPGAPTAVAATPGNGSAMVSFTAPQPNGGSALKGYLVTSTPGNLKASGLVSPITVNGLANGTQYSFTVTALNAKGSSDPSAPSDPVTPVANVPAAPAIGSAVAGNGSATVTFSAPESNGGSAITGYTVTSIPGGITATGTASPLTVSGLANGTTYTFTVSAANSTGSSAPSAPSNFVTPMTVPGAPAAVSAVAEHLLARVSFTAPVSDGGSAIYRYTVTSTPGNVSASGTGSPITVTGLADGTSYTFTVTATNAAGTGGASAPSVAVTPADRVVPVVRSFLVPGSATALNDATSVTVPVAALEATDNVAVTGYLIAEGSGKPALDDSGWSTTPQKSCTIGAAAGPHTVYAWAKDAAGNLSTPYTAVVVVTPKDTIAPVILSGPTVTLLTNDTAVLEWQTNEPALGGVNYGQAPSPATGPRENGYSTSHSMTLRGLADDTTYYLNVFASDQPGNGPTTSREISLHTKKAPDTVAPYVIEGPSVASIGPDNATIQWRTNEPAQGQVLYGTGDTVGQSANETGYGTLHTLKVTGLNPQTVYYLKVNAVDLAGNGPRESGMTKFATAALPDTTPPSVVQRPMAVNISDTGATLLWTTNEPASGVVMTFDGAKYAVFADNALANRHSVILTGLAASNKYTYQVISTDASGNSAITGNAVAADTALSFTTTAAKDSTPPVIVEGPLQVDTTHQSVALRWSTDEPSDSVVEYGTSTALGSSAGDSALVRTHNVTLTGLEAGTTYYFRVRSTDSFGNGPTSSNVFTFTTEHDPSYKVPVITVPPRVIYKTDTSMTVYWETDDPSDSVVEYGEGSTLTERVSNNEMVQKHQVTITNLKKSTSYKVVVSSTNMSGNTVFAKAGSAVRFLAMNAVFSGAAAGGPVEGTDTLEDPDTTKPQITAAPTVTGITDTQAVVSWSTDKIADSQVSYSYQEGGVTVTLSAGDNAQVKDHVVVITNLPPSTPCSVSVASTDPSGNTTLAAEPVAFATAAEKDSTAPVFVVSEGASNPIVVSPEDATGKMTLNWSTDEPATTQVRYGLSPDSMNSQAAMPGGLSTAHVLTLVLQPGTTYYLSAVAMDGSGNVSQSSTLTHTTMGTLDTTEPSTTATPGEGTYLGSQTVTLTADKPSTIYYTTDGSTPTTASAQYNGPVVVASTKTLKYFAIDGSGNREVAKSAKLTIQYAVSAAATDQHGAISCPSAVNYGEQGVCTVIPVTGYRAASISGCGGSLTGAGYTTGAVVQDCSITASFTPITYTVTPAISGHGTISPATAQTVNHGATTSFSVAPAAGYQIASVTGCGGTLSGTDYTIAAASGNCSVSAVFSAMAPDGDINRDGTVDVADAVRALRIAVKLVTPTDDDKAILDVYPMVNGKPSRDNSIGIEDALLILKKAVGIVNW